MLEVEPGNKTGIYYITVSNVRCSIHEAELLLLLDRSEITDKMQLPFNTQWMELKDFVRTVCEVDYVEVFNASTHAWVRVLGYEDYVKAFRESPGARISIV